MIISTILELFLDLLKNMSIIILLAYLITRTPIYAVILNKKKITPKEQACLMIVFGLFSIFGTLSGIDVMGALANTRDLGPAIAGLIGGPLVGLGAGLIGGIHRYFMGGFTQNPCAIATIIAGIAGGIIHHRKKGKLVSIGEATVFMALMETFHMGLALVMVRPFHQIFQVIRSVTLPMVLTNALGMGIFIFMVHNLINERETLKKKELIEGELAAAREIQMSILPKIFPPFPERREFDLFAVLESAKEIGGDLYDFFLLDEDHICFTVGDVSGKGVPASLVMAVTKTLIKAKSDIGLGPNEILYQVNNALCEENESGTFVTVFLGLLSISTGTILYSNGGHELPYLRRENGKIETLPRAPGVALGVLEDSPYIIKEIQLKRGDSLVLFTDGVTEAMNKEGDFFSKERLEKTIEDLSQKKASEQVHQLLKTTKAFTQGALQSDDITILVLKYYGL